MSEETLEIEKKSFKKIKWSSERVMSISALFVSAISLFALFYQLNLSREENELIRKQQKASVLPYLSESITLNDSEGYKIVIENRGVGPAFIKKIHLTLNDTLEFDNTDKVFEHIFYQIEDSNGVKPFITSSFGKGSVLPANKSIYVVQIKDKTTLDLFEQFMLTNTINFTIVYDDVYGTRWSLSNKDGESIPQLISSEN